MIFKDKKVVIIAGPNAQDVEVEKMADTVYLSYPEVGGPKAALRLFVYRLKQHARVVVLTRYPEIVNYLGALIDAGKFSAENATLILADPEVDVPYRQVKYSEDGVLGEGWVFGYFEPDFDEIDAIVG